MKCDTQSIQRAVDTYNQVTKAHKKPPVVDYVQKKLSQEETVEIVSGHPRWSSALRFSGTPDAMKVEFVINDALPDAFKNMLEPMKAQFEDLIERP